MCTEKEFTGKLITETPVGFASVMAEAEQKLGMTRSTATRYVKRGVDSGVVGSSGGLYWRTGGNFINYHIPIEE